MISSRARYAIRALVELARGLGEAVPARLIAERQDIPLKSLEQVLSTLAIRQFVRASDRPGEGYLLARPAREITIGELVREMDGPITLMSSVEPFGCECGCTDPATCRLRGAFEQARDAVACVLDSTSLHDVAYNRAGEGRWEARETVTSSVEGRSGEPWAGARE